MKRLDTVESLSVEASGFTKTVGIFLQNLGKSSSVVGLTKARAFA